MPRHRAQSRAQAENLLQKRLAFGFALLFFASLPGGFALPVAILALDLFLSASGCLLSLRLGLLALLLRPALSGVRAPKMVAASAAAPAFDLRVTDSGGGA
jgi:hypothetical protein